MYDSFLSGHEVKIVLSQIKYILQSITIIPVGIIVCWLGNFVFIFTKESGFIFQIHAFTPISGKIHAKRWTESKTFNKLDIDKCIPK